MDRATLLKALSRVPPFDDPKVRRRAVHAREAARHARRRAFERLGSDRYSRPARLQLDRRLEPYLPAGPGFFVEAGAHDGVTESNTYYLERFRGWTGVLIEPVPELVRRCRRERPGAKVYQCALVAGDHPEDEIVMVYGGTQSVVKGAWTSVVEQGTEKSQERWAARGCRYGWEPQYEVRVPARTLTSVLEEAGARQIDLLSLDVEGYEPQVLQGLDLERFPPALVLVEVFEELGGSREQIEAQLGSSYVLAERLTPNDLLYQRVP